MEIYLILKHVPAIKYSYSSSEMFASCCIMCVTKYLDRAVCCFQVYEVVEIVFDILSVCRFIHTISQQSEHYCNLAPKIY
jgi:hypothetical protein